MTHHDATQRIIYQASYTILIDNQIENLSIDSYNA